MKAKCGVLLWFESLGAEAVCGDVGRIIQAAESDTLAGFSAQ